MISDTFPSPGADSLDSVVIIIDGPVDDEVRPCRPSLRAALKAETEKLARYRDLMRGNERGNGDTATER